MLAFPGVIYSQPLYFEWLSPGITEDTRERKGGKETGRRRRWRRVRNGMSNRREREAGSTVADMSDGLKGYEGYEKAGRGQEKGIVAGWLAGFYWQLGGIAYCFSFYLLYGLSLLSALLRFACASVHECTYLYIRVLVPFASVSSTTGYDDTVYLKATRLFNRW